MARGVHTRGPVENPGNTTIETKRTRLDFLDGVRGLAALYVVVHHAYLTIWAGADGPYGRASTNVQRFGSWMLFGRASVDVFIVLSVYCLMLPVLRKGKLEGGMRQFYWRRVRRILPTYYAAAGLSLLLIWLLIGTPTGSHWDHSLPVNGRAYLATIFLLQDFYGAPVNHVFWSIATEVHIYLVFPLIVWMWLRVGGAMTLAVICLMISGAAMAHWQWLPNAYWYVCLFGMGALAASAGQEQQREGCSSAGSWIWRGAVLASVGVAVALCVAWGPYPDGWRTIVEDLAIGVATGVMLVMMARSERCWPRRVVERKWIVFVGLFSYSLYLIHAPLLQVIWQYGIRPLHVRATVAFGLLIGVGMPVIVGVTYLFYLGFERRFAMPPGKMREKPREHGKMFVRTRACTRHSERTREESIGDRRLEVPDGFLAEYRSE